MNYDRRIRIQAEQPGRAGFLWTIGQGLAEIALTLLWWSILGGIAWALWHFRTVIFQ